MKWEKKTLLSPTFPPDYSNYSRLTPDKDTPTSVTHSNNTNPACFRWRFAVTRNFINRLTTRNLHSCVQHPHGAAPPTGLSQAVAGLSWQRPACAATGPTDSSSSKME